MVRAGLGVKSSKPQHIANTVKQVFAHEYREKNGGGMFFSPLYVIGQVVNCEK